MYLQECKSFPSFFFTAFSSMERIWLTFSRALIKFVEWIKKNHKFHPSKQYSNLDVWLFKYFSKNYCYCINIGSYYIYILYIIYMYNVWMCMFILLPRNCWIFWIFQLNPIISIFHFSKHQRIRIMDLKWIRSNSKYMGRN